MDIRLPIDGSCRLDDWGVIRASGADAAKFLQGQLSNDVVGLPGDRVRLAGFCSAKGRLQASFVVWHEAAGDGFLLACSASLLASTLKRLSMFVLRARCRLSDASGEVALWGVAGDAAATLSGAAPWERHEHGALTSIRLPDAAATPRCLVAAPAGVDLGLSAGGSLLLATWRWLEVQSGIVTIEAATVDRFVPQMVNYELVGGVDFQKGCYPGQEVVARSQYRGTTKRRTFLFDCDAPMRAGQDVYASAAREPAGTVANAAPDPSGRGTSALVEVRLAALGEGELHLGSVDGPALRQGALPYPVPLEAEAAA
jgi:folate-binding protein YgfZ